MDAVTDLVRRLVDTYIIANASILKTAWYSLAISAFLILSTGRIHASYGRYHVSSSLFPNVNGKLGWMIMELCSPISASLFYTTYKVAGGPLLSKGHVLLAFWYGHYLNRAIISVLLSPEMKNSRVDIVLMSGFFNFVNAGWIGSDFGRLNDSEFTLTPRTILGLILFVVGITVNISSDYHLQQLRREKGKKGDYVLPGWGLFKYILSPNYAGETVEWIGFALMMGRESAWSFVLWTVCNLWPRAAANYNWYMGKFGDKVGNRKSIIPGVY